MNLRTQVLAMLLCGLAVGPVQAAETVEYIHTDALGSPVAITDVTRVVIERSDFEPYGALVNRPLTDGPGYTGHVTDAATGLTYMQQRYYDPQIGRFLSVDPVTADGSSGANFNRYWYANNSPYKFTDPDGRESACVSIGTMCGQGGPSSPKQDAVAGAALDFTPVIGDLKGIVEAVLDPSAENLTAAAVGLIPVVGDVAGKVIKNADNVGDAIKGADNAGDAARGTIYVDSKGNAIVTPAGGKIEGSPDGRYIQAKDANGKPTGVRIDGGHNPKTHADARAQGPHGHVPGVKNEDGTPWLPVKQKEP